MDVIFLQAALHEKIWGGTKLRDDYHFDIPSETTGEAWVISAHPNGPATVIGGEFAGLTLQELYDKEPELFGRKEGGKFPLLVKIIDAKDDLSVQLHPNDAYALEHENELGKTESWYILAAEPGAQIVYGHNAQSRAEFEEMIKDHKWKELLHYVDVKPGEFYYVPAGTIHAIGKGITILETQQNSDTTYRVYDYDRKDKDGKLRDLHLKQSLDVAQVPHQDPELDEWEKKYGKSSIKHFVTGKDFAVYRWHVDGELKVDLPEDYYLATVVEGQGKLFVNDNGYSIKKGQSFILPYEVTEVRLEGQVELIVSHVVK
ncbi:MULTISPECIES: mannose-6-phosphate isomerase, class I [Aerococcus]|uniref:Mannose-6-phosphate isomerase n=1 Tax=Aerococcus mictus TaxID=2976810 RepID=A0A1E9PKH9_9LACT|nr:MULTISPECIES: mannose-6-phosphate isomerase, class I [Aerococcus]AEA00427.1 mannose-6-phosphate isomerase, class I [Aerococcus sp. Group 1]KAA9290640.1 mannose-6-phosphate isomerase, class I [Aerococcus mictus]MBU5610920.1 mannose-6-phosphate isomerase, class I [Aerococcus urinae]MCY3031491.1 mannose-6-phosphate isomerase, class I [Aerococcus sp. Group 1]MCY3039794.1 mannose-6-phosphate isomerase, class I [Aerococcus sp. Group 2]